jgi:hypothetical protein
MISREVLLNANNIRASFQTACPFKHSYLHGFLDPDVAEALLREFPAFDREKAINEYGEVGRKAVNTCLSGIGPTYKAFYDYLFSEEFLTAMSAISGIPDLIGDATLYGGGTHENLNGQELDPHVDFNFVRGGGAHRRMNLLIYLNKNWRPDWGGAIEVHSNPRDPDNDQVVAYNVDFNKALLFETSEHSWHGFQRICLPPELVGTHSRKCLSIYLYTKTRPAEEIAGTHATFYVQRPLAERFKAGRQLTEQDVRELVANYRGRDRYIEYYQKQEERFGRKPAETSAMSAAPGPSVNVPIVGSATHPSIKAGDIWSDGWASRHLFLQLEAVRELKRAELNVVIPESAPGGIRHFILGACGARVCFEVSGHGPFAFTVPLKVGAGDTFSLSIDCDRDFNLSAKDANGDRRDLAYLIERISVE